MNSTPGSESYRDPDDYADDIYPLVKRLSEKEQVAFALNCASSVAHFYRVFDKGDLSVERAVRTVELWLAGKCTVAELKALHPKVKAAFERASIAYDVTDQWNNIYNASPAGVIAYHATEAARSIDDLLSAAIYSTETERDDFMEPAGFVAYAAAAALAATIFSSEEVARQARLLSAVTSLPGE